MRAKMIVEWDLDQAPDFNHEAEDMAKWLEARLKADIGHYNPTVTSVDKYADYLAHFGEVFPG